MCVLKKQTHGRLDVVWFFRVNRVKMMVEVGKVPDTDVTDGTRDPLDGCSCGAAAIAAAEAMAVGSEGRF